MGEKIQEKTGYIPWAVVFIAAGVFLAGCVGGIFTPRETVVSPHIDPVFPGSGPIISVQTFPFEKETVTISFAQWLGIPGSEEGGQIGYRLWERIRK